MKYKIGTQVRISAPKEQLSDTGLPDIYQGKMCFVACACDGDKWSGMTRVYCGFKPGQSEFWIPEDWLTTQPMKRELPPDANLGQILSEELIDLESGTEKLMEMCQRHWDGQKNEVDFSEDYVSYYGLAAVLMDSGVRAKLLSPEEEARLMEIMQVAYNKYISSNNSNPNNIKLIEALGV